jgi:DNA-binding Xre family transcriptional regulator
LNIFPKGYDVPTMTQIVWRVEQLAAQRGWGARQLAEAAGLDQKTTRNILAGRATRVDLETIGRLAQALGVGPGSLWDVEPDIAGSWQKTAGAAGEANPGELEDILAGRWSEETDPALERALRAP